LHVDGAVVLNWVTTAFASKPANADPDAAGRRKACAQCLYKLRFIKDQADTFRVRYFALITSPAGAGLPRSRATKRPNFSRQISIES
jgi:hypothetical protein